MSDTQRRDATDFRARLTGGEFLVGTFIKTPTGHATKILELDKWG